MRLRQVGTTKIVDVTDARAAVLKKRGYVEVVSESDPVEELGEEEPKHAQHEVLGDRRQREADRLERERKFWSGNTGGSTFL